MAYWAMLVMKMMTTSGSTLRISSAAVMPSMNFICTSIRMMSYWARYFSKISSPSQKRTVSNTSPLSSA